MIRAIHTFFRLPAPDKILFLHAYFMLGWAAATTRLGSFSDLVKGLEHHREMPASPALPPEQIAAGQHVGRMVARAARYTPWRSLCLSQVIVTQRLLAKRGISGQFYLGVRKTPDGVNDLQGDSGLKAHAWLQCDSVVVNGAGAHSEYTVISTFRWGDSRV